jgi:hypothetical protein
MRSLGVADNEGYSNISSMSDYRYARMSHQSRGELHFQIPVLTDVAE